MGESDAASRAGALLDALEAEVCAAGSEAYRREIKTYGAFKVIAALADDDRADVALEAARRYVGAAKKLWGQSGRLSSAETIAVRARVHADEESLWVLTRSKLACSPERLDRLCEWSAKNLNLHGIRSEAVRANLLKLVEARAPGLSEPMRAWLEAMIQHWLTLHKPDHARVATARSLLGESPRLPLEPGEAWTDAALSHVSACPEPTKKAWTALITLCANASASAPTGAWSKEAAALLKRIGQAEYERAACAWFALVDKPRTLERIRDSQYEPDWSMRILDPHMDVLKGLCWISGTLPSADMARALGRLALSAYRKVPGVGPRAVKVGNAAVYTLGQMPGMDAVGQLAMLRVKVKFGTAQKGIEKALTAAAEREGLPREEMDELGVPSYGLTDVGLRREEMGEYIAELRVTGIGDTELRFLRGGSKPQKSVPAAIKETCAEELKELKAAAKDIGAMLPAQRDRLDSLFLEDRTWPFAVWRDRYLDHPLVGVLARSLVWNVGAPGAWRSISFLDGALVDSGGVPQDVGTDERVRLWHPLEASGGADEASAWRRFFEEREVRQPFKQAHREVYLLTDAERTTGTYSNRYAAHIIRQHQFHALCGVRGWNNQLRLMVDAEYPPASRTLRPWGLRAEFWIEGAGDAYGVDTNEAGTYNLLSTDQVRFYRIAAAQATAHASGGGYGPAYRTLELQPGIPLQEIPPLVFSEVMRDVDLFVGVASVANNPEWQDGGPGGVHRNYWWNQSFAELSEIGAGRRELLERLLPRLAIAPRCTISGRFLVVRGNLHTYKIHLGSGNILIEPDDRYLCIVPSVSAENASGSRVFLPFEGDRTLSIILSKALLLTSDDAITEPAIVSQLSR